MTKAYTDTKAVVTIPRSCAIYPQCTSTNDTHGLRIQNTMGKKRQRLKPGKRDGDGLVISVLLLLQATHSGLNPGELPTQ